MAKTGLSKPIARDEEFDFLLSLLGKDVPTSSCVVVSGPSGCGKSSLVKSVLSTHASKSSCFRFIDVSCLEACPHKASSVGVQSRNLVLFDLILYEFAQRYLPEHIDFEFKCDSAAGFIEHLAEMFHQIAKTERYATFCITLHQAEKLRDMPENILPMMVNLYSLVSSQMRFAYPGFRVPSVVTLLLTSCTWDKFYSGTFAYEPTCLYLKAYTREELARILISTALVDSPRYAKFVDILLTVCLPVTRNIKELLFLAKFNWKAFNDPVERGLVDPGDEWAQYRCALPTLKRSLTSIYLRPEHNDENSEQEKPAAAAASHLLELPLYPRYLLVAAYIASYNPKAADKRFLVKNTGKMSSRGKHHDKKVEYTNYHLHSPRPFPLDRMLAIFYALISLESGGSEALPPLTALLTSAVGALCGLGLIAPASSAVAAGGGGGGGASGGLGVFGVDFAPTAAGSHNEDPLFCPRYRCLVSLETAKAVAKSLDLEIGRFLLDFV